MKDAAEPDTGERDTGHVPRRRRSSVWRVLGVVLTTVALLFGAALPAAAAELMRVTFVRHGQSAGNASGLIDTSTPGPVLTELGQQQARDVVGTLGDNNYDGIYASTMVRTQLTAAAMSLYLRLPIQVLSGLQEIEAGVFEGTPESEAADGYAVFPLAWAFQGDRDLRIPGSIDGHEFDARVDGALETIYDNGDRNPVVFSHGGAIMFWTMMNAQNLTLAQKIDLLRTAPLGNTDYVIIEGDPDDGWTLVNWNGQLFSPEPTLGAEVRRQLRTLNGQLADSVKQFFDSFASRDFATIATAFNRSVADAVYSIAKYHRAVHAKVINDLDRIFGRPATATSSDVSVLAANPDAEEDIAATDTAAAAEPTSTVESEAATSEVAPEVTSKREVVETPAGDSGTKDDSDIKEDAQAKDEDTKDDHTKEEDVKDDADALTDSTEDASDRDDDTADKHEDTADKHYDTADEGSAGTDTSDDTSDRSGAASADSADSGDGSKGGDTDSGSTRDAA